MKLYNLTISSCFSDEVKTERKENNEITEYSDKYMHVQTAIAVRKDVLFDKNNKK